MSKPVSDGAALAFAILAARAENQIIGPPSVAQSSMLWGAARWSEFLTELIDAKLDVLG